MSFNWNIIGKKISLLYEEMEYQSDYNTDQFINDLKTEMMKKVSIPNELSELEGDFRRIQLLRNLIDKCRSILSKLFSFTNNPNGVDMLIEYCDYYQSYCFDSKQENVNDSPLNQLMILIRDAFMIMARNGTTERVLLDVWETFLENIGWSPLAFHMQWTFDPSDLLRFGSLAMVIMADSDLNAAVQAFIGSYHTFYKVSKVLVQEPIKEQLLNTMRNEEFKDRILSNLFVFRNIEEALGNLNSKDKVDAISIWSENIIAAKKFAANVQTDTIWINALGLLDFGLHSIHTSVREIPLKFRDSELSDLSHEFPKTHTKTAKKYDHFYGGKWQSPVNGKYWTNQTGDSIAEATEKDFRNCANAARGAFKIWRSTKLSQRVKVIRCFAERLRANGESEYAGIVLKLLDRPLDFGTLLSIVRDGEAEILTTPEPVGVIAIASNSQETLFAKLIIASVTGNAVTVVLKSDFSVSFAPYCDLLGTCGFPPGVINCMFTADRTIGTNYDYSKYFDRTLPEYLESPNQKIFDSYKHRTTENTSYNNIFISVTKPKSIWIPIQ